MESRRGQKRPELSGSLPDSPFPKGVAKPAQRALASIGVYRLEQVTRFTESQLTELHGMGPKAIEAIKQALHAQGKTLAKET